MSGPPSESPCEELPVPSAPDDDPVWSFFYVNPYSRIYLKSVAGQRQYERAWKQLRGIFGELPFLPTTTTASPAGGDEITGGGVLECCTTKNLQAEWHEPTWERPRIESGHEVWRLRKDFLSLTRPSTAHIDPGGVSIASRFQRPLVREFTPTSILDCQDFGALAPSSAAVGLTGCDGRMGLLALDSGSLMTIAEKLLRSDLPGLGRLRCTCRSLRDLCGAASVASTPVEVPDDLWSGKGYNPLASVSNTYVAEIPVRGSQSYDGRFVFPVCARDFPSSQRWFSNSASRSVLESACKLLCRQMPDCFEFVAGCGIEVECQGFQALETMFVHAPLAFDLLPCVCYYAPQSDNHNQVSFWLT